MAVDVRWATTEDAAALAVVLCEMAAHYRQPPLTAERALSAAQKWLGDESPAYPHFALAFVAGEVRGLASVAARRHRPHRPDHRGLERGRASLLRRARRRATRPEDFSQAVRRGPEDDRDRTLIPSGSGLPLVFVIRETRSIRHATMLPARDGFRRRRE